MRETGTNRIIAVCIAIVVGLSISAESAGASEDCYACHRKAKNEYQKFKFSHKPVRDKDCESCHKQHGFAQKLILKDDGSRLCYTCHADLEVRFKQGEVHFPVGQGKCWDCHNPHGSNTRGMLLSLPKETDWSSPCQACHGEMVTASLGKSVVHSPFGKMDCLGCHAAHNSLQAGLLTRDINSLCGSCHSVTDVAFQQIHEENHAAGLACDVCHLGHASDSKGLLADDAHAPFAGGDCETCHSMPDTSGKVVFEEGTKPGQICGACHDDVVEMTSWSHPHAAVEADNCDNCHNSHASRFGSLLRANQRSLCGECHDGIPAGTGKTPHWPVMTGDCGSCHEVHGSKRIGLLKSEGAELCLSCHKDFADRKNSVAVKHAALDDCLGCHSPHEGHDKNILRVEAGELCRECHEVDRKALVAFSGHQPYLEGKCNDCHLPHFSKAAHLVEGGTGVCVACHVEIGKKTAMTVPHAPAVDDCQTCHRPHYSDRPNLLVSRPKELCLSCHDYNELNLNMSNVHTAAREGDCTGCHDPHGGDRPGLITGRTAKVDIGGLKVSQAPEFIGQSADLCYTCHGNLATTFRQKNAHAPVAQGNCDACHDAHGSDHNGFVVADAPALCGTCHALDSSLYSVHGGYDLSSADCLDCHNPHVSNRSKLVRNISHPPFADKDCESCHEKNTEGQVALNGQLTELCAACHESVSDAAEMKHIHAPFAGDDCGGCHRWHAADTEKLLRTQGASLCSGCHSDVKDQLSLPVTHVPFAEGQCLDCHFPHASPYKALATNSAQNFCSGCHGELEKEISAGEPHAPVADRDCGSCHKAHAGTEPSLLTDNKLKLCGQCHDMQSRELRASHKGFPLADVDCQNCHAAHAGPDGSKGLLLPNTHAAFADGTCTTCHEGLRPHKLVTEINQLCFSCHEDFTSDPANSFVHASVKSDKGCLSCHGAHVGYGPKLLLDKQGTALCLSCHDGEAFQGSVKHPQAFENCGVCHKHHAADNKELLTNSDIVALCTGCHTDALKAHYHPIGAGTIDRRTGKPLTCVGCHKAHSSDYNAILTAENDKSFCVSCHSVSK